MLALLLVSSLAMLVLPALYSVELCCHLCTLDLGQLHIVLPVRVIRVFQEETSQLLMHHSNSIDVFLSVSLEYSAGESIHLDNLILSKNVPVHGEGTKTLTAK